MAGEAGAEPTLIRRRSSAARTPGTGSISTSSIDRPPEVVGRRLVLLVGRRPPAAGAAGARSRRPAGVRAVDRDPEAPYIARRRVAAPSARSRHADRACSTASRYSRSRTTIGFWRYCWVERQEGLGVALGVERWPSAASPRASLDRLIGGRLRVRESRSARTPGPPSSCVSAPMNALCTASNSRATATGGAESRELERRVSSSPVLGGIEAGLRAPRSRSR